MHLTDEQLYEYLDQATNERIQIELHLASCPDCAARLSALQSLFDEIESLPDEALSPGFAVRVAPSQSPSPQLPRSLTLTMTLQAVLAVVAITVAGPFILPLVSPYMSGLSWASFTEIFLQLQGEWTALLDMLATLQTPAIPEIPVFELSSLFIILTVIGVSLLWLIGNGLLLRNQMK